MPTLGSKEFHSFLIRTLNLPTATQGGEFSLSSYCDGENRVITFTQIFKQPLLPHHNPKSHAKAVRDRKRSENWRSQRQERPTADSAWNPKSSPNRLPAKVTGDLDPPKLHVAAFSCSESDSDNSIPISSESSQPSSSSSALPESKRIPFSSNNFSVSDVSFALPSSSSTAISGVTPPPMVGSATVSQVGCTQPLFVPVSPLLVPAVSTSRNPLSPQNKGVQTRETLSQTLSDVSSEFQILTSDGNDVDLEDTPPQTIALLQLVAPNDPRWRFSKPSTFSHVRVRVRKKMTPEQGVFHSVIDSRFSTFFDTFWCPKNFLASDALENTFLWIYEPKAESLDWDRIFGPHVRTWPPDILYELVSSIFVD
jgi:hypothetical protein